MSTVGFDRVEHLVRVPVTAGEATGHRFLVDTGIGITLVSSSFAARAQLRPTSEVFAGRRMSGQLVEVPLVVLPALRLADLIVEGHLAGVLDLGEADGPSGFDGILSLGFFDGHPFTVDPAARTVTVQPTGTQPTTGVPVPLEVRRQGPSVEAFVQLVLPSGQALWVEVDTGTPTLILDERFLGDCGLSIEDPAVSTTTGTDETGHAWVRHWAVAAGSVHLAAAPQIHQHSPQVQFQKIIHDGLVGTDFLDRHRVTYDTAGARMVVEPIG